MKNAYDTKNVNRHLIEGELYKSQYTCESVKDIVAMNYHTAYNKSKY